MQSLQPDPAARYRNVLEALWRIIRTEGLWRPMRGLNVTATGAGPAHALYFACYEKLKKTLSDVIHPGGNSHIANGIEPPCAGPHFPNSLGLAAVSASQPRMVWSGSLGLGRPGCRGGTSKADVLRQRAASTQLLLWGRSAKVTVSSLTCQLDFPLISLASASNAWQSGDTERPHHVFLGSWVASCFWG